MRKPRRTCQFDGSAAHFCTGDLGQNTALVVTLEIEMKLLRRLMSITLWTVTFGSSAMAADMSEYRQITYGPPDFYCDPTRSLASAGAGTLGNPWNMTQCAALPVAGDVVGIMPGVMVPLPTTNNDNLPAFRPANAGTAVNRIVYVTRFAAVALADVATNPNRTAFRHNGSAPSIVGGIGAGTGCAMIGTNGTNYVTFDGFFIDMAQAYMKEDSGVIRVENSTGVHFRNFVVKGANLTVASNAVIYRPQNAVSTVLRNFRAYDFVNDPTGSNTPQMALFSDQYGDRNFLIEQFEISNTGFGIFLKGTASGNFNYGTVRYGIIDNVRNCFRFNDLHATELTTIEYNLCRDSGTGFALTSETTIVRNLLIHHNTVARIAANAGDPQGPVFDPHGGFWARFSIGANVTLRDNIVDLNNGPFGHEMDFGEVSTVPATMNFNVYTKNTTLGSHTPSWAFNGAEQNSLAAWRTATGRDANSLLLASGPFVNRAGGDFHVPVGNAAKTASSTGQEVGAYATGATLGVDTTSSLPGAPTNLRITP
jgi:hypothetical protein